MHPAGAIYRRYSPRRPRCEYNRLWLATLIRIARLPARLPGRVILLLL